MCVSEEVVGGVGWHLKTMKWGEEMTGGAEQQNNNVTIDRREMWGERERDEEKWE